MVCQKKLVNKLKKLKKIKNGRTIFRTRKENFNI